LVRFELYLKRNAKTFDDYLVECFTDGSHPDMRRYLYGPLAEYTKNSGKRHRPIITLLAAEAVGGDPKRAKAAAAAIEHFHTVDDPVLDDATKLRVLKELVDMTTRTIEGQALDIGWARDHRFDLTTEDYLLMAAHKTAYYSGAVPLAIGGIVGGGTDEQITVLREFGYAAGLAFQIQDDVLNLVGTKAGTQKDFRSDITEGKRTLVAIHALQNSPKRDRLLEILSSHTTNRAELDEAVEIMQQAGSIEYAQAYALGLVEAGKQGLIDVLPKSKARDLLVSMADFFVSRSR